MNKKIILGAVAIILLLVVGYLFLSDRLGGYDVEILIDDLQYLPSSVNIERGMTVRWTNVNDVPHTVNSQTFDSGILEPGDHFDFRFEERGVYVYVCALHPEMRGVIAVD